MELYTKDNGKKPAKYFIVALDTRHNLSEFFDVIVNKSASIRLEKELEWLKSTLRNKLYDYLSDIEYVKLDINAEICRER